MQLTCATLTMIPTSNATTIQTPLLLFPTTVNSTWEPRFSPTSSPPTVPIMYGEYYSFFGIKYLKI